MESDVLSKTVSYAGAGISVRSLEDSIAAERARQKSQVDEIRTLEAKNEDLQMALSEEIGKLRKLSDQLTRARMSGFSVKLRELLAKLPGFRGRIVTRRSVEDLLRRQYEISAEHLKEAAEFADRLEAVKHDLYDEIERLNGKIVESARNEELAADRILELKATVDRLEDQHREAEIDSARRREIQAEIDRAKRSIGEHTTHLRLYDTAEERLDRLKISTANLAETIAQLGADITMYVTAASEKLDLIAGQIQAIGAAADASLVMLELKHALDALTDSVNHTTRFVSETQAYFRDNVDGLVEELNLYDAETERVLADNLAASQLDAELRIDDAVSLALAKERRSKAESEP